MAFEIVDSVLSFVPAKIGNFIVGRLVGIGEKDNGKSKFAILKTLVPAKTDDGEPIFDEIAPTEVEIGDAKKAKQPPPEVKKVPRLVPAMYRIPDAATLRKIRERLHIDVKGSQDANFDFSKNAVYMLLSLKGFQPGENQWPDYAVGFGSKADMEDYAKQKGAYMQLDPRAAPAKPAEGGAPSGGVPAGGKMNPDDIPF